MCVVVFSELLLVGREVLDRHEFPAAAGAVLSVVETELNTTREQVTQLLRRVNLFDLHEHAGVSVRGTHVLGTKTDLFFMLEGKIIKKDVE